MYPSFVVCLAAYVISVVCGQSSPEATAAADTTARTNLSSADQDAFLSQLASFIAEDEEKHEGNDTALQRRAPWQPPALISMEWTETYTLPSGGQGERTYNLSGLLKGCGGLTRDMVVVPTPR